MLCNLVQDQSSGPKFSSVREKERAPRVWSDHLLQTSLPFRMKVKVISRDQSEYERRYVGSPLGAYVLLHPIVSVLESMHFLPPHLSRLLLLRPLLFFIHHFNASSLMCGLFPGICRVHGTYAVLPWILWRIYSHPRVYKLLHYYLKNARFKKVSFIKKSHTLSAI